MRKLLKHLGNRTAAFIAFLCLIPVAASDTGNKIAQELQPYLFVDMTKEQVSIAFDGIPSKIFSRGLSWENPFICNEEMHFNEFNSYQKSEILRAPRGKLFFSFGNVTLPASSKCKLRRGLNIRSHNGTGVLIGVFPKAEAAFAAAKIYYEDNRMYIKPIQIIAPSPLEALPIEPPIIQKKLLFQKN